MVQTSKFIARFLLLVPFFAPFSPLPAQRSFSGAAEIEQSLHKLNVLGTVLMIAAHPDDERTAVLAYFARGRHMRTAYLSLTRGEGGQNLIGSEQGAQLGIIRTHELLDAREIDGAEQFFTRAIDFGFSKTAAETLEKWGHDRILADVVWNIRRYRPDVVILVFTGTPRDGHGHHQASAILGKEAFEVAGDPKRFPEQLKFVEPWRPRRLVHATFNFGPAGRGGQPGGGRDGGRRGGQGGQGQGTPDADQPPPLPKAGTVETGEFNPVLGYSYEELATLSRSMHHSQGTGAINRPGAAVTEFELVSGEPASKDLFDGIDTTWARVPGGTVITPIVDEAIRNFDPAHPERVIPQLTKARALISAIPDPMAKVKLTEVDEAIAKCAGLWIDAQARQPETTPGSELTVNTTALNRSNAEVTLDSIRLEGFADKTSLNSPPVKLTYNHSVTSEFRLPVPASQPYSQPYWLAKAPSAGVYTVDDQRLVGLPDTPPVLQMRVRLSVAGTPVELTRPVHYRYAGRAEGERVRPLVVVPAVAVNLPDAVALFPSTSPRKIHVSVMANVANATGDLRLDLPASWKVEPRSQSFHVAMAGEQQEMMFEITPPAAEGSASLRAIATVGGREIESGMDVIAYPHIPTQILFPVSDLKLVRSNLKVTAHKIGYIMGSGDGMPDALRQIGLDVALLTPSDLEQGDLSRFDAIVAGVRAYNVRSDLRANQPRLMDYVRNGGTYIVQYQSGEGGGPGGGRGPGGQAPAAPQAPPADIARQNVGPYPITIPAGNGFRVTVEEAPVEFPHVDSPLLQAPNHITPADFEGWVQERGLNFATQWDSHYQTVISAHDPGEKPLEGGELWTRYGKGVYIFTAYSWFRQLPAGVPGAYRLFANLLSTK
ncbi:MAG TPA: PIG-L family deacetylase [Bryobacteraceae bacterium]|nr:PIG-L family deacetylase [Bryobacteraceae bacterium]